MVKDTKIYLSLVTFTEYLVFSFDRFSVPKYVQIWDYSRPHVALILYTLLYQMVD